MGRLGSLALLIAVAGCATGPSRQEVLAALVGHPESDAIRTLGAPNREFDANGHKFLAWYETGMRYAAAPYFGPWGGFGYGWYTPMNVPVATTCETTLEIAGGRVASYTLRGAAC